MNDAQELFTMKARAHFTPDTLPFCRFRPTRPCLLKIYHTLPEHSAEVTTHPSTPLICLPQILNRRLGLLLFICMDFHDTFITPSSFFLVIFFPSTTGSGSSAGAGRRLHMQLASMLTRERLHHRTMTLYGTRHCLPCHGWKETSDHNSCVCSAQVPRVRIRRLGR